MRPLTKLEEELKAAEGQLDFYDGLHEGSDPKVRKDLLTAITDIKAKINKGVSDPVADA